MTSFTCALLLWELKFSCGDTVDAASSHADGDERNTNSFTQVDQDKSVAIAYFTDFEEIWMQS